jgi:hypothetical protein
MKGGKSIYLQIKKLLEIEKKNYSLRLNYNTFVICTKSHAVVS